MKHRMFMVVVAMVATLALAAPVGAASPNSMGSTNASPMAWHNWASFDGGMAPGLVPANDPAADEDPGDDGTEVDEDGDDGTEVEDDEGDEQADEGDEQGDESTDETTDEGGTRPQNHGWFVSQCAHDRTYVGREHGKHVKDCAHSQDGKPSKGDEGDSGSEDDGADG